MKLEDYAKDLLDAAGLSDAEQRKIYEQFFLSNPKVREKMESTLNSLDSAMGRASAEAKRAEAAEKSKQEYYQQSLQKWGEYETATKSAQTAVQRYTELYGELPPDGSTTKQVQQAVDAIDKKTFEDYRQKSESTMLGLITAATDIVSTSIQDYGIKPDLQAIVKIAQEKNLNAKQAFEEWIEPKKAEKFKVSQEAEINRRVEEKLAEAASRKAAIGQSPGTLSEFAAHLRKADAPASARENFIRGLSDPNPQASMQKEFGRRS